MVKPFYIFDKEIFSSFINSLRFILSFLLHTKNNFIFTFKFYKKEKCKIFHITQKLYAVADTAAAGQVVQGCVAIMWSGFAIPSHHTDRSDGTLSSAARPTAANVVCGSVIVSL